MFKFKTKTASAAVAATMMASSIGAGLVATPAVATSAEQEVKLVEAFFDALATEDEGAALSMLTEDAMLSAPYNPNGDASDEGVRIFPAALYVKGAMATYDNLVFVERAYSIADGGRTIWIEAEGRLRVAATGNPYENRYVFKIELEGSKIARITEYTNVATLMNDGVTATTD